MNHTIVEYVWIGGPNANHPQHEKQINYIKPFSLRSKTRILYDVLKDNIKLSDIPNWNFDGSSTGQATTENSEIFIVPRTIFNDPFRDNGIMVLCDTYIDYKCTIPHQTNTRYRANEIFNSKLDEEPWFGIEQEFFVMQKHNTCEYVSKGSSNKRCNTCKGGKPPSFDLFKEQGQYYCAVGSNNIMVRSLIEDIANKCLKANVKLSGWNAEVAPSQWEFQIGPLTGITASDHLWMLRYIMDRCTEETSFYIELHPKPIVNSLNVNGSGAHTNYSTKKMRDPNMDPLNASLTLYSAIEKLSAKHTQHIDQYGDFNDMRLIGSCETSSMDKFTYGIASRAASVRIPREVSQIGYGYFEDRRPSSIMDPYKVTSLIFETTCLN